MSINFEELDYQKTAFGELILRRRRFPILGDEDIYEVILNDEFLMSSLFTAGEIALSDLALACTDGHSLDILVGGLGLGYTAIAALKDPRVSSMIVIEALPNVISWHEGRLLPVSDQLNRDPRCEFCNGDFFDLARKNFAGLNEDDSVRSYHAVLLDIDHSPAHLLQGSNRSFYSIEGLEKLKRAIYPGGVFALWSNDAVEKNFLARFASVFPTHNEHRIEISNPLTGTSSFNTIYLGKR